MVDGMARRLGLVWRVGLALVAAFALLAVATLVSFYVFGYLVGFSGHPAVPDLPMGCFVAYMIGAPVLALAAALWWVVGFDPRRRSSR